MRFKNNEILLISMTRKGLHPLTDACIQKAVRDFGVGFRHTWGSSDLPLSRSKLLLDGVKSGAKVLVCIDGDMTFNSEDIDQLLEGISEENRVGAVGAFYMRRGEAAPAFQALGDLDATLGEGGPLVPVAGVGLGLTAVYVEALKDALAATQTVKCEGGDVPMWCCPFVRNNRYYPDDLSLCWRLRTAGWKVCVDFSVEAGHISENVITAEKTQVMAGYYKAKQEAQAQAEPTSKVSSFRKLIKDTVATKTTQPLRHMVRGALTKVEEPPKGMRITLFHTDEQKQELLAEVKDADGFLRRSS